MCTQEEGGPAAAVATATRQLALLLPSLAAAAAELCCLRVAAGVSRGWAAGGTGFGVGHKTLLLMLLLLLATAHCSALRVSFTAPRRLMLLLCVLASFPSWAPTHLPAGCTWCCWRLVQLQANSVLLLVWWV
jgi:hypothetical protein